MHLQGLCVHTAIPFSWCMQTLYFFFLVGVSGEGVWCSMKSHHLGLPKNLSQTSGVSLPRSSASNTTMRVELGDFGDVKDDAWDEIKFPPGELTYPTFWKRKIIFNIVFLVFFSGDMLVARRVPFLQIFLSGNKSLKIGDTNNRTLWLSQGSYTFTTPLAIP